MASDVSLQDVRAALRSGEEVSDWFDALRRISFHLTFADPTEGRDIRDLVIRSLDRRSELNGYSGPLDSLAVAAGLYPYARSETLGVRDALEYETHRPFGLDEYGIVFHRVQADVYRYLLEGQSVILSAPTSFGKSLIIDALLASERYGNVAIVVPTLALIDETRRRVGGRFGSVFKLITHPQQSLGQRNVFIMTQERVLDVVEFPPLDLFVIDEFYKLDPSADADRSYLLNQAFYRLRQISSQFYLLGPSIETVPAPMSEVARVVVTDFATVALDTVKVDTSDGDESALARLCSELVGQPTIVFCKSPKQARDVANVLVGSGVPSTPGKSVQDAARWAGQTFHPDWSFVRALKAGVGLHHGRLPRSLAQYVVRAFNQGDVDFLVCTSTLIEGVNTAAKNVVIYDNKIALRKYDFFTFNNIRGRGGRMFSHFIGRVYLFHPQPAEELRNVDIPAVTQPPDVKPSLLVQLDDEDLTEESRALLATVLDEEALPLEDVRSNPGVDPVRQIALARRLRDMSAAEAGRLSWSWLPSYDDLRYVCQLLWEDLDGGRYRSAYVRSSSQLAFRLSRLRSEGLDGLIEAAVTERDDPDEAVEEVLDFVRHWAGFHFPRLLRALDRIQRKVFGDRGLAPGNYALYASSVESLFLPRSVMALDEYGIPIQVAMKLAPFLDLDADLDAVLGGIHAVPLDRIQLSTFERTLLSEALEAL